MDLARKHMNRKNGLFVEGEIFCQLKRAARETGVVFGRGIDFAKRDLWVKTVEDDHVFQPLTCNMDDLGVYADNYNSNSLCRLLDVKSGMPDCAWMEDDENVQLFLMSMLHDLDTIYVIPRNRVRVLGFHLKVDKTWDFESPPHLPLLLPYRWTSGNFGTLLQQIAAGKPLQNPETLMEIHWDAKEYRFRDEVHSFSHPTHQASADSYLFLQRMIRPSQEMMGYRIRLDFCDLQPLFGDLKIVDVARKSERVIQHKTSTVKGLISSLQISWSRASDKWDFLIGEDRGQNKMIIYTRDQFTSSHFSQVVPPAAVFVISNSNSAILGYQILQFLAKNWDRAREGWLRVAENSAMQIVLEASEVVEKREGEEVDPNAAEETQEVGRDGVEAVDKDGADDNAAEQGIRMRQQAILCAEYNVQARQRNNLTRIVPFYSRSPRRFHPYGDAIIVLLDQDKASWDDEKLSTWFWSSGHGAFNTPCVMVQFAHQDLYLRAMDNTHFLLNARNFRLPATTQKVFYLGIPHFRREVPEQLLLFPSKHVRLPPNSVRFCRDANSREQQAYFGVYVLRDFDHRHGVVYPLVPEAPFWNSLSDITDSMFQVLSSMATHQPLFAGTDPIQVASHRMTFREVVQAMVTHGVGLCKPQMELAQDSAADIGSVNRDASTKYLRVWKLLNNSLPIKVVRELCSLHGIESTQRKNELITELLRVPGIEEIANGQTSKSLSKLTPEKARELFLGKSFRGKGA